MDPVPLSSHIRAFEDKVRALDKLCGAPLGKDNYDKWLEEKSPKIHRLTKNIRRIDEAGVAGLQGWKDGTPGWLGWIYNWFSGNEPVAKVSAEQPYKFEKLEDSVKEEIESKSAFHKTAAKVISYTGIIFMFAAILGPFALLPLFLSLGSATTGTIIWCLTGLGVVGTALAIGSIYLSNTESIRLHRAKTDPDFQFFIDRIVQKGVGINITEDDLTDDKIHAAFLAWKDGFYQRKELFSKEKRETMAKQFPKVVDLFKEQPEMLARDFLKEYKKTHEDFDISSEKYDQSVRLFKEKMKEDLEKLTKEIYEEGLVKSPQEIDDFVKKEKEEYEKILQNV